MHGGNDHEAVDAVPVLRLDCYHCFHTCAGRGRAPLQPPLPVAGLWPAAP